MITVGDPISRTKSRDISQKTTTQEQRYREFDSLRRRFSRVALGTSAVTVGSTAYFFANFVGVPEKDVNQLVAIPVSSLAVLSGAVAITSSFISQHYQKKRDQNGSTLAEIIPLRRKMTPETGAPKRGA